MSKKGKIIHIVKNKVLGDSRVLRSVHALANEYANIEVVCVGYSEDFLEPFTIGNVEVDIVSVGAYRGMPRVLSRFFKYLVWHYKIVNKYKNDNVVLIHNHELIPLLISVHLKLLTKSYLIYDAHELETECRTNKFDLFMKPLYKMVEKFGINRSNKMIVVSDSIKDWYSYRNKHTEIEVIYNCPDFAKDYAFDLDRKNISKPIKFIYCGALVPGRGIDIYLDVFSNILSAELFFLGAGPLQYEIESFVSKFPNIKYLGNAEPQEVVLSLACADVSLCMIEDNTLTSKYCMPNKLFESIVAGLPVIVNGLPDLKTFVEEHQVGWVVDYERNDVERFVLSLDVLSIEEKKDNVMSIRTKFTWLEERKKLLSIYKAILNI